MSITEIISLVVAGVAILGAIATIIVSIVKGEMKKFIEEKMIEAEQSGKTGAEKLQFVLTAVKEKYKLFELFLDVKKFVERIIELTKQINVK